MQEWIRVSLCRPGLVHAFAFGACPECPSQGSRKHGKVVVKTSVCFDFVIAHCKRVSIEFVSVLCLCHVCRWASIYFAVIVMLGPVVGVAFFLAVRRQARGSDPCS